MLAGTLWESSLHRGKILARLAGWLNYHAVPGNSRALGQFVDEVSKYWLHTLRRRSQNGQSRWTWSRMCRLIRKHLPRPRVLHPYPSQRFPRLKVGAV
jgi:hypothetical protein